MTEFFQGLMELFDRMGAPGLFLLAVSEASWFPVAPDLLLIPLVMRIPEQTFVLACASTLGSTIGGLLGYAVGHFGGRPLLLRFAPPRRIEKVEAIFARYGAWGVAVAGFVPAPFKMFTIASGVCHLRLGPFVAATAVGRGVRFFLVAYVVKAFGWHVLERLDVARVVVIGLALVLAGVWFVVRHRRLRTAGAPPTGRDAPTTDDPR